VLVPRRQACCGAIHHHGGDPQRAAAFARRNIEAFENCDAIVANVAGCGAMLKEYADLLSDDPQWSQRARRFAARVRDVNEWLLELDPPPPPHRVARTVTVHDACHLVHAQKVTDPPRRLLERIEGLQVRPLPESTLCCGAAGTYNLEQPEMSAELAERKIDRIAATGCDTCISANIGCTLQIASAAAGRGMNLDVVHTVDLLHEAYLGPEGRR